MATPPPGELPVKYSNVDTQGNTDLQNVKYLFQDQLTGVETVAVDSNGQLGLVDKYGKVRACSNSKPVSRWERCKGSLHRISSMRSQNSKLGH
jgi:hypothetical protein